MKCNGPNIVVTGGSSGMGLTMVQAAAAGSAHGNTAGRSAKNCTQRTAAGKAAWHAAPLLFMAALLLLPAGVTAAAAYETAIFAGGCFWCMEPAFEKLAGVQQVVAGYTGGQKEHPTYEAVSEGLTGHVEAVQVTFDPAKISYEKLLAVFWRQIDPTDEGGQFADRGAQYRSAIFYLNDEQKRLAVQSKNMLQQSGKFQSPIVTGILPAGAFYPAEQYHQGYYKNNPADYQRYRSGSGRDQYLEKIWGAQAVKATEAPFAQYRKPSQAELTTKLTPLQYQVTQQDGTEPAFNNAYWNNKKEGIYVDIVSGEPLFSSRDKFDSGTGWPSFTRPLAPENIIEKKDSGLLETRTEVRSKHGDSHLGHVFNDGPPPTGLRYCMNSAALRFVARQDMEKEGYGRYLKLFEGQEY